MNLRQTLVTTIALFLFALPTQAQLSNGLLAHWTFNGHANDVSGNNYHGTPTNVTYTPGILNISNTAASFNGMNSYISIPYQASMNLDSFSICAVVKLHGYYSGTCQANYILSRAADHTPGHYSLMFSDNAYDTVDCYNFDTSKQVFYSGVSTKTRIYSLHPQFQYSPTIVTNRWYCVVTTYANDTERVYVDGNLVSTGVLPTGSLGTSTEGITIGSTRYGKYIQYPYWLNGEVDDLRLYNRQLSDIDATFYCEASYHMNNTANNNYNRSYTGNDTLTANTIEKTELVSNLKIYPNPASNTVNLVGAAQAAHVEYYIQSGMGQLVNKGSIEVVSGAFRTTVNTSELASGLYIIKIVDGDRFTNRKLTIQH